MIIWYKKTRKTMIQSISKSILIPKPKSFPRGLIYNVPKSNFYRLIDSKKGIIVGEMLAYPESNSVKNIYDAAPEKNVFRIYSLEINFSQQRMGWGKYFIDFAKKESYKQGCEGRLYLVAYNPYASPHVFYKKQGLVARDKRIDHSLNACIKGKEYCSGYPACEMYLPLDKVSKNQKAVKKKNLWDVIKTFVAKKNK